MDSVLDNELRKELADHVEKLTHSGEKQLNPGIFKKLKDIFMKSDGYVEYTHHLVMHQLKKQHAEIRFSAFQICEDLFKESQRFRDLLVADFRQFLELTVETNPANPMPRPVSVAKTLRMNTLKAVYDWYKTYGNSDNRLKVAYSFLIHNKRVDFNNLLQQTELERRREEEEQRRRENMMQEKLRISIQEMNELQPEISNTITAMSNAFSILLPHPKEFFVLDKDDPVGSPGPSNVNISNTSCTDEKPKVDVNVKSLPSNKDANVGNPVTDTDQGTSNKDGSNSKDKEETDSEDDDPIDMREFGIVNRQQNITIELKHEPAKIEETEENAAVIENLRDMHALITNRYLPSVKSWITVITKASGSTDQLKRAIDIKLLLEGVVSQFAELQLPTTKPKRRRDSDDSDSDDFEEVEEKEGYEKTVGESPAVPAPKSKSPTKKVNQAKKSNVVTEWSLWSEENDVKDPTTALSTVINKNRKSSTKVIKTTEIKGERTQKKRRDQTFVDAKPSTSSSCSTGKDEKLSLQSSEPQPCTSSGSTGKSRKEKLLAVAPKLPFDIDLYHWEDDKLTAPTMLSVKPESHRFWTSAIDLEDVPVPEGVASLRTRVIEFSGKFEPVKWACRAPLPNGKLCPRRDRHKCPFHGPIVPRDAMGTPQNSEQEDKDQNPVAQNQEDAVPDWQDPELLKDLEQATGLNLKLPEKRKKGGKVKKKKKKKVTDKFPGLTDINAKQNTVYKRLSKKIFKRSTMKRVAADLDTLEHKKFRDKYGDQWNYACNT